MWIFQLASTEIFLSRNTMAIIRRRRKFRKFTVLSGTATGPEMSALQIALEEIERNQNPNKAFRGSWSRLKIQQSLPRQWGTKSS